MTVDDHDATAVGRLAGGDPGLERRGRRWIFGSFALCPCHLPLTLGVLATVLGGTAAGAMLRDHLVVAGAVVTAAWVAGTWRGFRLVRLAQRGACPVPAGTSGVAVGGLRPAGPGGPLATDGHRQPWGDTEAAAPGSGRR